ncbi:MAG: phosphate ABC transporter substrate-binding protein PstS [Bacteroidota bacterium]
MRKITKTILFILTFLSIANSQIQLNGAGATFPYVIYSKWFDVYKNKTAVQFNYQSIGSGGGIRQVSEGTVDFGATDGPMNDKQLEVAKLKQNTNVLHIPTVMGAVAVAYNLPTLKEKIKLSSTVLAEIFLGTITKWNDPKISKDNPKLNLPDMPILVVHRSDGSGTTYIFVDYLSKVSEEWKSKVGLGTSVNWPVGLGGKGNEGVAGQVKQLEGTIGYVELAYAIKNNLQYASVQNKSGNFIEPSLKAVTEAANSEVKTMPEDFRVSITNSAGKTSYPISGFTWLLVLENQKDQTKGKELVKFLKWAMKDGQAFAEELYYAPLPPKVIKLCLKSIDKIKVQK